MRLFYNLLVSVIEKILPLSGPFSEKMKLFVEGRKDVVTVLEQSISSEDLVIWIHTASLGEYEQAVPVIVELKKILPKHKILLSFFSPSGFEVKKNASLADVVTYLPLDTTKNAKEFLDLTHPELVLFIKYEFWPNFLHELKDRKVNTLLISGSFREDQIFFRSYGKWMQSYLKAFDHFFVQNRNSKNLLNSIGLNDVTISGDTRFDRVSDQINQNNDLAFIEEFKDEKMCLVAGSTWPEDEDYLLDYIKRNKKIPKIIIAPHTLKPNKISTLKKDLGSKAVLFSEKEGKNLSTYSVFIVDTIGLLSKVYSYADIAYVGGAVGGTGLHNVLEPATFGVPIITGDKISRFPEALELKKLKALFPVSSCEEFRETMDRLVQEEQLRKASGRIAADFVRKNSGATGSIIDYIERLYKEKP